MAEMVYNSGQVIRHTGITMRQLDHWCMNGWLHAGNEGLGSGHNTKREFTWNEVEVIRYATALTADGIRPKFAIRIARLLVKGEAAVLADGLVTIHCADKYCEG